MTNLIGANKALSILFVIFTLSLLILLGLIIKISPLTISHTIYYCQKAITNIILTLPHSAPSIFVTLSSLIIFIGLMLLIIKTHRTYRFVKVIIKQRIDTPNKVLVIARKLGITNKIDIIESNRFSSFCYGLFKPRICLSLNLVKSLNIGELEAVLIHESYHLKNRDPLKILLSQIAASMFFFIPTIGDFHNYYTLSKEVDADRLAIKMEKIRDLRSALTKTILNIAPALPGIASLANGDDLEKRVQFLIDTKQRIEFKLSFTRLIISVLFFTLATLTFSLPVFAIKNSDNTHSYFICLNGSKCTLSCYEQGVIGEIPFGKENNFTPINYSPSTNR